MSDSHPQMTRRYLAAWRNEYQRVVAIVQAIAGLLLDMGDREQRQQETDVLAQHLRAAQTALRGLRMLFEGLRAPPTCAGLHRDTLNALSAYDGALSGLVEALRAEGGADFTEEALALGRATERIGEVGVRAGRLQGERG